MVGTRPVTFDFIVATLTDLTATNPHQCTALPGSQTVKNVYESGQIKTLLEGASFGARLFGLKDNAPVLRDPRNPLRNADILTSNARIHTINRVLIPVAIPWLSRTVEELHFALFSLRAQGEREPHRRQRC